MEITQPKLQEAYDTIFIAPYASHRWKSKRARSHWVNLEGWQDAMAGPLSAIARSGGCDYVYAREDAYFADVIDPSSLRAKLIKWHSHLAAGVERFEPVKPKETIDWAYMRSLVGQMRSLIAWAMAIEQARWDAAHM